MDYGLYECRIYHDNTEVSEGHIEMEIGKDLVEAIFF